MTEPTEILLQRGGLTGRVYAITRWRYDERGNIVAEHKVDVTSEFEQLLARDREQVPIGGGAS